VANQEETMDEDDQDLIYLGAGPLAAIVLGIGLVALRGFTTASNFTFLFLALTIVVGELGGRIAAIVTAVASALSLNFFLTEPYLTLRIDARNDLIAFLGLAGCGVLAAALAKQRGRGAAARPRQLAVLRQALAELPLAGPLESRLLPILEAARTSFPLQAACVRDRANRTLAASQHGAARPIPALELDPRTLLAAGAAGSAAAAIPAEGGRVPLVFGNQRVGWLDLWGGAPASPETRHALGGVASALAALLAQADR
jgi:two-component system sensor histidine kinase KdpD